MKFISYGSLALLLSFSLLINGELTKTDLNELLALGCNQPSVTLHVFSTQSNPTWTINDTQMIKIKSIVNSVVKEYHKRIMLVDETTRIMGYNGFSLSCSTDKEIFINGIVALEKELLNSGRTYLPSMIVRHVTQHMGQSLSKNSSRILNSMNCNSVPIKGSDKAPTYNPQTDHGGCFITKQSANNCYAYGKLNSYLFFKTMIHCEGRRSPIENLITSSFLS